MNTIYDNTFVLGQTSATNFIAGNGIKIDEPSAGTVRIGNDETVLYSGTSNTASMTFSESPYNFEKLRFIPGWDQTTNCVSNYVEVELGNASYVSLDFQYPRTDIWNRFEGLYTVADSGMTITQAQYIWGAWGTTTATTNTASKEVRIKKVIGINRIGG